VLVAYAPLDAWQASRHWVEQPLLLFVEYALVFLALSFDFGPRFGRASGFIFRGNAVASSAVSAEDAELIGRTTSPRVDPSAART